MRRGIAAKRLGTAKFSSLANAREHFLHGADHGSTTWTSTRDVGPRVRLQRLHLEVSILSTSRESAKHFLIWI